MSPNLLELLCQLVDSNADGQAGQGGQPGQTREPGGMWDWADVKTFQLDCNKCRDAAAGFAVRHADRQTLIWLAKRRERDGERRTLRDALAMTQGPTTSCDRQEGGGVLRERGEGELLAKWQRQFTELN